MTINMHDARFNLRALVKELLLLEDHLSCTEKQCHECIVKHALKSEAWIDEALTLNPDAATSDLLSALMGRVRVLTDSAIRGASCSDMALAVRELRRELQKRVT
jgi:hypothetical protein